MEELSPKKETVLFEWHSLEFSEEPKSREWFFGVGLVAAALAIWSAFTLNIMFFLVIIVSALALFLLARREPKEYHFKITTSGIWADKEFLPFHSLESFWIFESPHQQILSVKAKSRFSLGHHLFLREGDSEKVKGILTNYLPEVEEHYSLIDWLSDWLRI